MIRIAISQAAFDAIAATLIAVFGAEFARRKARIHDNVALKVDRQ
jgi:hypothetical protein